MAGAFAWIKGSGTQGVLSGCSSTLPQLANWAARRSLTGMEFAVSIPGSVGGAVRMNAGAHGSEIADHLVTVTLFDLEDLALAAPGVLVGVLVPALGSYPERCRIDAGFELEPSQPDRIREADG